MKARRVFSWSVLAATSLVAAVAHPQQPARTPGVQPPAVRLAPAAAPTSIGRRGLGGTGPAAAAPSGATPTAPANQPPTAAAPAAAPAQAAATTSPMKQADTTGLPQFPEEVEFQPRPAGYRVAF
ncbi:MAG TPA: hypothetical protein PLI95_24980, partial [Polyangiaceae bacterium]|nr:hypothetical protein [Polyangiaceae bacterium]